MGGWRFERFTWGIWWIDAVFSVVIGIGMMFIMYVLASSPQQSSTPILTILPLSLRR
jgi:hypothetical protein